MSHQGMTGPDLRQVEGAFFRDQ